MSRSIALVVGGGINQEITPEVLRVIEAAGVDIVWERVDVLPAVTMEELLVQELAPALSVELALATLVKMSAIEPFG